MARIGDYGWVLGSRTSAHSCYGSVSLMFENTDLLNRILKIAPVHLLQHVADILCFLL